MAKKRQKTAQAMTPERLRRVLELRRSGASGSMEDTSTRSVDKRKAIKEFEDER